MHPIAVCAAGSGQYQGLPAIGGDGSDEINGGLGRDTISAGPGNDTIRAVGGGIDVIDCGPGRDRVEKDSRDRVRDCEIVL